MQIIRRSLRISILMNDVIGAENPNKRERYINTSKNNSYFFFTREFNIIYIYHLEHGYQVLVKYAFRNDSKQG